MANYDQIMDAINSKMDRELNLFNQNFERILKRVQKEVEIRAVQLIDDPLLFDREFQAILSDTGYYRLINDFIDNSYDKTYGEIQALLNESGIQTVFTQADLDVIRDIKRLDIQTFRDVGNQAAASLKRDLYKYSLSNLSQVEIADNIAQSLAGTSLAKYSKTYAETALSDFQQKLIDNSVSDIADQLVYVYRGPTPDGKIRDFCKCVINQNKYYTLEESNKLKNDPRRKWNCRHEVAPMIEELAISEGYTKGNFSC